MRFIAVLVCAVIVLPNLDLAQTAMPPDHQHTMVPMVDGKTNPSAIPDLVAYRLILSSFSRPATASAQELARQRAQIKAIKLTEIDAKVLRSELADFNLQFESMVQTYNAEATKLNNGGKRADILGFLAQRDQLVQTFVNEVQSRLSPNGWSTFLAFVQREKIHMQISAPEAQQ